MVMRKITGDDGKATFELPYGDYTATIKKNGYATVNKEIAFRSNHKNFTEPLYVGGMATIKVYGMFGMTDVPLENATVTATSHNGLVFTGTTDANGVCSISMPYSSMTIGDYEIVVTKDGFTQDGTSSWEFYDDQNTYEVYMRPSTATVTINVVDSQSQPTNAMGVMVLKSNQEVGFEFDADGGTTTLEDVYYGTYLFGCGVRDGGQYFCEVIVDSETETVNARLQDTGYSLTVNDEISGTPLNMITLESMYGSGDSASFVDDVAQCTDLYGFYTYNIFTYDERLTPPYIWKGGAKDLLIDENKSITYDAIRDVTINFVDESGNILDFDEEFAVGFDFEENYRGGYASGGTGVVSVLDGTYKVILNGSASYECNATITIDATHTVFNIIATQNNNSNGNDYQLDAG